MTMNRFLLTRGLAVTLLAVALGGCATSPRVASGPNAGASVVAYTAPDLPLDDGAFGAVPVEAYAAKVDDGFALPRIPAEKIDPKYLRQRVLYQDGLTYEPGTVVVDTATRFLYVVEAGGTAMRYGIGVGKSGFSWAGEARIQDKQHWPKWFPPAEMIARRPDLKPYAEGMQPGLSNPLGARALYLYQNNKDTLYRLHGTPEWWSIGTAASSGCIRLMNQDIIDLYERVPMNARVVVKQGSERVASR
ncbi:L,D-transpeptidase [Antarcticirhabdus aurantiaca]|uniref:L,D-transpeptidase n=1 Tax=Antarcticirhabdus aurantiaca TaxID=2606717 RepID=A0ACD4NQ39_9HYPH|nr:L,D-transpeptidase [Antarcticirhabdus aurantiaca]WAJ28995.1 L,D-transpeptidase [Jeongeuplla avenae]